jgi:hypothetical protein
LAPFDHGASGSQIYAGGNDTFKPSQRTFNRPDTSCTMHLWDGEIGLNRAVTEIAARQHYLLSRDFPLRSNHQG